MSKRPGRAETTKVILDTMDRMIERAKDQRDFTAEKVAAASGVSAQLMYRYAGPEFRSMRGRLPGPQVGEGGTVTLLRRELAETNRQLRVLSEEHARCPGAADIDAVVVLNEQLEVDNRALRAEITYLRAQAATDASSGSLATTTLSRRPRLVPPPNEEE